MVKIVEKPGRVFRNMGVTASTVTSDRVDRKSVV
jgi:hypothetical protein